MAFCALGQRVPARSPVLTALAGQSSVGLIAGELENLPVQADLKTGYPYLGFSLPKPNDVLEQFQQLLAKNETTIVSNPAGPPCKLEFLSGMFC